MKKILQATLLFLMVSGFASANSDPSKYLEGIANNMISVIEKNKEALKTDGKLAENLVREYLLPAIDKESFARKTLGSKTWTSMSDAQQQQFVENYLQRVINKYAKGLSLYDGQAFEFAESEISEKSGNARVKSELKQTGSEPLGIYYYLRPSDKDWLITNMVIAGTSVTKSNWNGKVPKRIS